MNIQESKEWSDLLNHYDQFKGTTLRSLFAENQERAAQMTVQDCGWFIDFSKNLISQDTIQLLLCFAERRNLANEIQRMFAGDRINDTENRSVLHVALRNTSNMPFLQDGKDVMPEVNRVLGKMEDLASQIRSGQWKGYTGKKIKNIVNIGIGGSDLGPVMAYEALKHYTDRSLVIRFISNIDGTHFVEQVRDLKPDETLFIIASKTFPLRKP